MTGHFIRWNQHCMSCGDLRGGPFGHETSECRWKPGMEAWQVAEIQPDDDLKSAWWDYVIDKHMDAQAVEK